MAKVANKKKAWNFVTPFQYIAWYQGLIRDISCIALFSPRFWRNLEERQEPIVHPTFRLVYQFAVDCTPYLCLRDTKELGKILYRAVHIEVLLEELAG